MKSRHSAPEFESSVNTLPAEQEQSTPTPVITDLSSDDEEDDYEFEGPPTAEEKRAAELVAEMDSHPSQLAVFFRELGRERERRINDLEELSDLCKTKIARELAFCPPSIPPKLEEEKAKMLKICEAEIFELEAEVQERRKGAAKIMQGVIYRAKEIGDRLRYAKACLLKHGQYEDWVQSLGISTATARVYSRIANPSNWEKLRKRAFGLTLEEAVNELKRGEREEDTDKQRRDCYISELQKICRQELATLDTAVLRELSAGGVFSTILSEAIKKRAKRKKGRYVNYRHLLNFAQSTMERHEISRLPKEELEQHL